MGGVVLGIRGASELRAAYADLAARLGPGVCEAAAPGAELSVIARDPDLGPLVVVGAGGVLVELLADRAVALPPVTPADALRLVGGLRAAALLADLRGQPPADLATAAVTGVSAITSELGSEVAALDVNPLICARPERRPSMR